MRRIASASRRAELTCWIFGQAWASGESGIESVTTTYSMGLLADPLHRRPGEHRVGGVGVDLAWRPSP